MATITELSKNLTIAKAEEIRKDIGVTQRYMCECIGVGISSWSSWTTGKSDMPDKYKTRIVEVFYALKQLRGGHKLVVDRPEGPEHQSAPVLLSLLEGLDILSRQCSHREAMSVILGRIRKEINS